MTSTLPLGASLRGPACEFRLWAPTAALAFLRLNGLDIPMLRDGEYFIVGAPAQAGDRYLYSVDNNKAVPDPVSRFLPEGVHGPTEVVDTGSFPWTDRGWKGIKLEQAIIYELHIGTFTQEGSFDAAIGRLEYLKNRLGVTAIEIMPVAAFPGERNWGYDGVSPYAVQVSYGGPDGLKRLVKAAHEIGLAVILDVVYNHLGNEGNYLRFFGPYFTDRHKTPWGEAINYALPGVREYVVQNALYWIREYHIDGLRLDAVQTIFDDGPRHILAEIQENVQALARELGREVLVIAESDENDSKLIRDYKLPAFWSDDFHHAVHAFLTGERRGYYQDFGSPEQIARALGEGYVFQGEYFRFWNAPRGTPAAHVPLPANVICIQNHDQVGNRAKGERLNQLVPSAVARKAAGALLLLAPHTPLLFMGQEYDENAPFQFFTNYTDPTLQKAVSEGRREEFKDFDFSEVPDPEDPATFLRSKLNWDRAHQENEMLHWYQALIVLRKKHVVDAVRSAKAELRGGILTMLAPATAPRLRVDWNMEGGELPEIENGWTRALFAADGSNGVAVYEGE